VLVLIASIDDFPGSMWNRSVLLRCTILSVPVWSCLRCQPDPGRYQYYLRAPTKIRQHSIRCKHQGLRYPWKGCSHIR
jgi:hypothetical protein